LTKNSFGYEICPRCGQHPIVSDNETVCGVCSFDDDYNKEMREFNEGLKSRKSSRYESDFLLFKILIGLMAFGIGAAVMWEFFN
jgi:ribosomal protein L37E